ncbi:MAG: hypothetical protein HC890_12855 [Chloroflexaceae bacterium]|nr:hypothetical protein [Chloroflexaceae bacterium]
MTKPIIISCRTAAYRNLGNFRRFSDIFIADFDDGQIDAVLSKIGFARKQIGSRKQQKSAGQFFKNQQTKAAKELAKNAPITHIFYVLAYDRSQTLPSNRSVLYRKALRILLEEWAAEKRIERVLIYEGLHTELEEELLAEISHRGFQNNKLFFNQQEIVKQIKAFLTGNLNAPQHLDGEAVLKAISVQQGILVERAEAVYSFSHLTLQEYLTAKYIVDNNAVPDLVNQYITEDRWKEVFLLVAGLMPGKAGADPLLLAMEAKALDYLKTPLPQQRFIPLLQWAEDVTTGSTGDLSPVAKRSVAIAIVIAIANAYAYADVYNIANTIVNAIANADVYSIANTIAYAIANATADIYTYANAYVNIIDCLIRAAKEIQDFPEVFRDTNWAGLIAQLETLKTQIPNRNQLEQVYREFAERIIKVWLNAFYLTREMVEFAQEELAEIDRQYFYIYWLMLECKKAAVKVSPETWAAIEDRMFRVPASQT